MLIRATWTLAVAETVLLPRAYSLELSKTLHQQLGLTVGEEAIPSTSFSGIVGRCSRSGDFLAFHPGERYQLSLSGLQDRSAKAIANWDLDPNLELFGTKFEVSNRKDDTSSYPALYTTLVANEPEPRKQFDLEFPQPTAFAQDRLHLPLPVPALMFRSWLERWNHFAPVYLGGNDLIDYLKGAIALRKHRLQTRPFRLQQGTVNGFIGDVSLTALNRTEPLLANVAHLLVAYAPFAGTGIKTRLGMGYTLVNKDGHCD